jgi:hypothetical protein
LKPSAYRTSLALSAKPNPSLARPAPLSRHHPSPTRLIPPVGRNSLSLSLSHSRSRDSARLARHRDDPANLHAGKRSSGSSLTFHSHRHLSLPSQRPGHLHLLDILPKYLPSTTTNLSSTITIPFVPSPFSISTLRQKWHHRVSQRRAHHA